MILRIFLVIVSYMMGSISPSIILAKAKGIDIKKEGSGNAGTTNALRVLGKKAAIVTLICDMLKGVIPTLVGSLFDIAPWCALFAFAGHIWPIYYGFKGGKGAATAVGCVLALDYRIALLCLAIAALFLLISKRMSVGTIVAAIMFPILSLFFDKDLLVPAIVIALIVVFKHRTNIIRLIKGEEPVMSIFNKE